jgi:hypothetical protein
MSHAVLIFANLEFNWKDRGSGNDHGANATAEPSYIEFQIDRALKTS